MRFESSIRRNCLSRFYQQSTYRFRHSVICEFAVRETKWVDFLTFQSVVEYYLTSFHYLYQVVIDAQV